MTMKYDLAVIGAGSAGFSAAITAADAGKRVALVGHGTIGGTCVNVGCVPSKTMIRAAEALHAARAATRFPGLETSARVTDFARLAQARDDLVAGLRQKKYIDILLANPLVDYIDEGAARLVDGGVQAGDRVIPASKVIIATGSHPMVPNIPGIDLVPTLDSTALLALDHVPESLIFLGAGYIGAELAQMMARFGSKVSLLCRSRLLPEAEPEISAALAQELRAEGINLLEGITYDSCMLRDGRAVVSLNNGETMLEAAHIVLTTGRRANTEGLNLAGANIETDHRGAIVTTTEMRSTNPDIYAAGDVTDRDQFVYMAAYGARIAASNAVLGMQLHYDNRAMPWVVFTDPQIAGVGLTEAQAQKAGHKVKTSVLPLDQVPRALAARDTRGLIKLVADADSDRLLGGQIMAPEGADSIQTLALAIKAGMTARELAETIFPYLTTVEGLKLAAQTFERDIAQLSCCAG